MITAPPLNCIFLWAIVLLASGHAANGGTELKEASVRGVRPEDQPRYADAARRGNFQCKGDRQDGLEISLPFSAVNDDFCDCVDGSDEPGTGACAGQKETLFYCPNERSVPSYVYASHINDGICDCCDGSDEKAIVCLNTCEKEGIQLQRDLEIKEKAWRSGAAIREKLVQTAKRELESDAKELSALREKLPSLEAEQNATQLILENATAALRQEQERLAKNASANISIDFNTSEPEAITESSKLETVDVAVSAKDNEPVEVEKGAVVSEYAKWMDSAEEAKSALEENQKPEVSEYSKWMDGAEEAVGSSSAAADQAKKDYEELLNDEEESIQEEEEERKEVERKEKKNDSFFGSIRKWLSKAWETVFGNAKTPLERSHETAANAHDAAKNALSDARRKIEELEQKLERETDDLRLAYSALEGKCLSKKFTEYKYEICFFKNSQQDSISLGNWQHWESSHVALFDGGQYCHGGPSRSMRVRFECGPVEEISEVTEPSRCTYEARVVHPSACVGALPAEASRGRVRMPTDEL